MVEDRRFAGLDRLFGMAGAQKIRQSHVVVVGVGGVGSWAAESLARSGVGTLTLIDFDHVAESNINRQIHATEASLGQAKVEAMRERIHSFFPLCQVNCVDEFATPSNWPHILPVGVDAVIDACDQWHVKTVMANWAIQNRIAFISCGAAGGKRQAHLANVADLSAVTHDPLLSKVRYQLRKEFGAPREGKKIGLPCVSSCEPVAPPHASCGVSNDGSLNCHGFGSLVTVTATFGQCAAGFVLNQLAAAATEAKAVSPVETTS